MAIIERWVYSPTTHPRHVSGAKLECQLNAHRSSYLSDRLDRVTMGGDGTLGSLRRQMMYWRESGIQRPKPMQSIDCVVRTSSMVFKWLIRRSEASTRETSGTTFDCKSVRSVPPYLSKVKNKSV